jgi:O-antigen/teichoic acid export membrane protein
VPTRYILLARLLAGILNAAPPLVGSYAMGRDSYGAAASVLAIAAISFGVISQYLSQNLLRVLCTGQKGDVAVGAAMLFLGVSMVFAAVAHFAGLISVQEALQLATLVVALTLLRICEVQLISKDRIVASILVFYAAPPVLCSVFFIVAGLSGGGYAAAGIAQSVGYAVAALVAMAMAMASGVRPLLMLAIQSHPAEVVRELGRSLPLMVSGVLGAAMEWLPVVLLRGMNALAVIPVYEIARKMASFPTTLANPLLNQANPAMIRAYALHDRDEILVLMKNFARRLSGVGVVFVLMVVALLAGGLYDTRIHDVSQLLLPLSFGTIVAMWCVPYQLLLIAAQGDRWFTFSSGLSIVLLLSLSHVLSGLGPALAVSCAAGLSIAAGALIIRFRALRETYFQDHPRV